MENPASMAKDETAPPHSSNQRDIGDASPDIDRDRPPWKRVFELLRNRHGMCESLEPHSYGIEKKKEGEKRKERKRTEGNMGEEQEGIERRG